MKTFRLSDANVRVELFAAEPNVVDPVEVVFDENGRAYAAEMRDDPEDPPPGQPPRSRIRLIEDTDGDGNVAALAREAGSYKRTVQGSPVLSSSLRRGAVGALRWCSSDPTR